MDDPILGKGGLQYLWAKLKALLAGKADANHTHEPEVFHVIPEVTTAEEIEAARAAGKMLVLDFEYDNRQMTNYQEQGSGIHVFGHTDMYGIYEVGLVNGEWSEHRTYYATTDSNHVLQDDVRADTSIAWTAPTLRNIKAGTSDLTAGTSSLTTGTIYLVYE